MDKIWKALKGALHSKQMINLIKHGKVGCDDNTRRAPNGTTYGTTIKHNILTLATWKCSGFNVSTISWSFRCCCDTEDRSPSKTPLKVNFFISAISSHPSTDQHSNFWHPPSDQTNDFSPVNMYCIPGTTGISIALVGKFKHDRITGRRKHKESSQV